MEPPPSPPPLPPHRPCAAPPVPDPAGPDVTELPGWRVGVLFIIFLVVATAFDWGTDALDRYLKKRQKRALRHVVRRLQAELLVLGLLSLLLVAFEVRLRRERRAGAGGEVKGRPRAPLAHVLSTTPSLPARLPPSLPPSGSPTCSGSAFPAAAAAAAGIAAPWRTAPPAAAAAPRAAAAAGAP